jgi:hypothetical protein
MPVPEKLFPERLRRYRETTFNTRPGSALRSAEQAIQFVKRRGYILFWPNKGLDFPSLWCAVAGDRLVSDNHDDPAHKTWRWKDDMLGKNRWYYAKIIRQRSTIISLEMLPFFYALSPNYGSPEEDYLIAYQDGLLSNEEKIVYETILKNGPLDTLTLRESAGLAASESSSRFNRALNLLQRDFRILPVGVSDRGAWHYAFIYEASHRQFPGLVTQAKTISDDVARKQILKAYLLALGVASIKQMHKFFQWSDYSIRQTLQGLIDEMFVAPTASPTQSGEEWFTITGLE